MEKKSDYSQTVIYKIIPNNAELKYCYIGNTCDIEQRIKNHHSNCKNINSMSHSRILYKSRHEKTLKHLNYINNLTTNTIGEK